MDGISTVLTTSLTEMITNTTSMVADILPVALTIIGTYFVINKAISFFKKIANKA